MKTRLKGERNIFLSIMFKCFSMDPAPSVSSPTVDYDVIIVGGGVSGFIAASTLLRLPPSYKIKILEASNRLGGRIKSFNQPDLSYFLECGAEWVHGESAKSYSSILFDSFSSAKQLVQYEKFKESYHLPNQASAVTHPPFWNDELETIENFIDNLWKYKGGKEDESEISAAEYFNQRARGKSGADGINPVLDIWLGSDFGTSIDRLGMKSLAVSENLWSVGEKDFLVRNSYWDTLITTFNWERIVAENVLMNHAVTEIDYSAEASTSGKGGKRIVRVSCQNGAHFTCHGVIICVPLSMLKQRRINFQPTLPVRSERAIDRLQIDAGMKIHLAFTEVFWGAKVCEITLTSIRAFAWDAGFFKDGRNQQPSSPPPRKFVLVFMITGRAAERFSALPDEIKVQEILAELDQAYAGAASRSFDRLVSVQDWTREPFIEGCYSYPAPGTYRSARDNDRVDLSRSVQNCLWFAGEAAALYHPATVLGAMESGKRAAEELHTSKK